MNTQSNKKTTNKRTNNKTVQKETILSTIDETVQINPEVVIKETNVVIPEVANQELMIVGQEKEEEVKTVIGELVETEQEEQIGQEETEQEEQIGQEETDQPKLTYEQLMAIIEQQANSIEELKSNQPKQNQPINGGVLNTNGNSKADSARLIWNEEVVNNKGGCPVRSVTIKRFIKECGLTEKGAPTYYQNMKKAAGFVVSK
jgi:hypothetical protein